MLGFCLLQPTHSMLFGPINVYSLALYEIHSHSVGAYDVRIAIDIFSKIHRTSNITLHCIIMAMMRCIVLRKSIMYYPKRLNLFSDEPMNSNNDFISRTNILIVRRLWCVSCVLHSAYQYPTTQPNLENT